MTGTDIRHAQGVPCWASLMARDPEAAQAFYGPLLGWGFAAGPASLGPYTRAVVDGLPVAGIGAMPTDAGLTPDWITYFAADSADEVAQRARDNGGTVALGPMDADHAGRLAIAADPDGAVFGIWEGKEHSGWQRQHLPGSVTWSELATPEAERAGRFYTGVFGSAAVEPAPGRRQATVERDRDTVVLRVEGRTVAGIRQVSASEGGGATAGRPHWRIFFAVAELDPVVELARQLGGSAEQPPTDSRHGRSVLLRDPEGAPFGVAEPTRRGVS